MKNAPLENRTPTIYHDRPTAGDHISMNNFLAIITPIYYNYPHTSAVLWGWIINKFLAWMGIMFKQSFPRTFCGNCVRYCDTDRVLKCVLTARKHERPFVILDNVFLHRHVIFVIYVWNSLIYYYNGMDMGIFQPERSARCILIA